MQIVCLITLALMNGAYLFVSFNMELMMPDESEQKIESAFSIAGGSNMDFDPTDVLDLDIFDFDVEELTNRNEGSESTSVKSRRTEDLTAV